MAIRARGTDLTNQKGELTSHLKIIYSRINVFLEHKITPIFVFDGEPPEEKSSTLDKRRGRKKEDGFSIKNEHCDSLKYMLDLMGVPHVTAEGEADQLLAYMNKKGYINGVCSDDGDILASGAKYLYKNMSASFSKPKQKVIIQIKLKTIYKELDWEQKDVASIGVMLGCDYCVRMKGMGVKRAYEFYEKNNRNLKKVIKALGVDKKCYIDAFKLFMDYDFSSKLINRLKKLRLKEYDINLLKKFLIESNGFNDITVKNAIIRFETNHGKVFN
jgi:flap endonuclease-1